MPTDFDSLGEDDKRKVDIIRRAIERSSALQGKYIEAGRKYAIALDGWVKGGSIGEPPPKNVPRGLNTIELATLLLTEGSDAVVSIEKESLIADYSDEYKILDSRIKGIDSDIKKLELLSTSKEEA